MEVTDLIAIIFRPTRDYVEWLNAHAHEGRHYTWNQVCHDSPLVLLKGVQQNEAETWMTNSLLAEICRTDLDTWGIDLQKRPSGKSASIFEQWFTWEIRSLVYTIQ